MKYFLVFCGSLSLFVGVVGIFVPMLPTTPLLLLAAWCYFRSSPKLYDWLLRQKYLGEYIRNFRENKAIPLGAKVTSLSLLWVTMSYCILFVTELLWLRIVLACIAVAVTWHIARFKTLRRKG